MVFSLFQQNFKFIFTFACRLHEVKTNVMWMSRNLQIFCSQVSKCTQMCLQMYIACIEFYVLWPSERRIQSDKMRAVTFFFQVLSSHCPLTVMDIFQPSSTCIRMYSYITFYIHMQNSYLARCDSSFFCNYVVFYFKQFKMLHFIYKGTKLHRVINEHTHIKFPVIFSVQWLMWFARQECNQFKWVLHNL